MGVAYSYTAPVTVHTRKLDTLQKQTTTPLPLALTVLVIGI